MPFPYIKMALLSVKPLGLGGLLFSLAILVAGYGFQMSAFYRPLENGPSTHPLTAIMLAFAGLAAYRWKPQSHNIVTLLAGFCVATIALFRLIELASGSSLLTPITPYQSLLNLEAGQGHPIHMGLNTALMGFLIGTALILTSTRYHTGAQQLAFVSLGFPLVSIVGYAYGLENFHGEMSLTTVIGGIFTGLAAMLSGSHRGFLRSILSPWVAGRIARIQISIGFAIPFLLGLAIIDLSSTHAPLESFGLYVVFISAFITGLVGYSALLHDNMDRKRRSAERKLVTAATLDPLTGLANRRHFTEQAHWMMEHSKRHNEPLSIIILDIDFFKRINDRHGHMIGDVVLQHIATLIKSVIRRQDLAARYGGEEFIVLLPSTNLKETTRTAERLREAVKAESFLHGESVTVSLGCSQFRAGEELSDFFNRADSHLYQAKQSGRNQVVGAATEESPPD